ncbi:unnamed protein product [Orchesella dallaii]|uniref:G-protein coupled receptors family 1 profile domain-containing protein n=1 Tax=Orchesella dallaii TaxID=48710 RepID=A0ABP1PK69_9HEXA
MCMSLILDYWETVSLTAGCNLYSKNFRFCVLTVKSADQGSRKSPPVTSITPVGPSKSAQIIRRNSSVLSSFFNSTAYMLNSGGGGNRTTNDLIIGGGGGQRTYYNSGIITASNPSGGGGSSGTIITSNNHNMYFRERDRPVVDAETFLSTALPKILIASLIIFLNLLAIITMIRSNRWVSSVGARKGFYILPQSTQGLLHSLFVAYLLLGLLTLYSQVSLSFFILGEFRIFEDQGKECLTVNSVLIALSVAISLHLVSLAVDRTLASYLTYSKYSAIARGTVPLWLLAIWLPSAILGSLPLAGWKTNFSFCIFLHQFNDDYLRFVSGFYFCNLALVPALYIFFLTVLKPGVQDPKILYRWHRKLQAHHRLTFAMILAVNSICWTPFHLYLLTACLSCSFSWLANGFVLEYLYMIALAPSIIIPLMFSIRSSVVDKCASKIARCVTFRDEQKYNHNPLSAYHYSSSSASGTSGSGSRNKSPLFYIDEFSRMAYTKTTPGNPIVHQAVQQQQPKEQTRGKSFFVPKYLPTDQGHQLQQQTDSIPTIVGSVEGTAKKGGGGGGRYIKQGSQRNYNKNSGSVKNGALKNFRAYINKGYRNDRNEAVYAAGSSNSNEEIVRDNRGVGDGTDDTDSQCGFPIPSPPPGQQNAIYSHYYSRLNIDGAGTYGYR